VNYSQALIMLELRLAKQMAPRLVQYTICL